MTAGGQSSVMDVSGNVDILTTWDSLKSWYWEDSNRIYLKAK